MVRAVFIATLLLTGCSRPAPPNDDAALAAAEAKQAANDAEKKVDDLTARVEVAELNAQRANRQAETNAAKIKSLQDELFPMKIAPQPIR